MVTVLTRSLASGTIRLDMPALAKAERWAIEQIELFARGPRVWLETAVQRDLRKKFDGLLAGQSARKFDVDAIYSGPAWNFPTHIVVSRLGDGFNLVVKTKSEHPYGERIRTHGGEVDFFELVSNPDGSFPWVPHSSRDPWEVANEFVDRIAMATSNDVLVKHRYQEMRAKEQKEHAEWKEREIDTSM